MPHHPTHGSKSGGRAGKSVRAAQVWCGSCSQGVVDRIASCGSAARMDDHHIYGWLAARPDGPALTARLRLLGIGRLLAEDPDLAHAFSRWWFAREQPS